MSSRADEATRPRRGIASHASYVGLSVVLVGIFPVGTTAQTADGWFVGGDAGAYEVHDESTGLTIALQTGRQWGPIGLRVSLTHGFGYDSFTTLEPGLHLALSPFSGPLHVLAGAGGGLMWENTLSLPYYLQVGIGVEVRTATAVRAVLRRGSHAATGDSGTFRGPHTITVGVVRYF